MMWQLEDYKEKHRQNHKLAGRPWVKRKAKGLSKLASSISNTKDLQLQNIIHELEKKFEALPNEQTGTYLDQLESYRAAHRNRSKIHPQKENTRNIASTPLRSQRGANMSKEF